MPSKKNSDQVGMFAKRWPRRRWHVNTHTSPLGNPEDGKAPFAAKEVHNRKEEPGLTGGKENRPTVMKGQRGSSQGGRAQTLISQR